MEDTGKWVVVAESTEQPYTTMRLLYRDRRGRECVRYRRDWRLVKRTKSTLGYRYVIGKPI